MSIITDRCIHATMSLVALPGWGGSPPIITITGPAPAVIAAVGRLAGLAGGAEDAVTADLRRCPVHEGDWVIVDARQAESYPATRRGPGAARGRAAVTACIEMPLVLFEFSSDDLEFRSRLFKAIDDDQCPDFTRSLGGSGRNYAALWRPDRADAVRAWARSIGVEVKSDDGRG